MRRTSFADFNCSLARSLEMIGDWWTPLILRDLALGLDRFDELATDLGISRNLLTTRLGALVDADIVARVQYCEKPPRYSYRLTNAGLDLMPIIAALTAWGDRWTQPPGGPPILFNHQGHRCTPAVCCSQCGNNLEPGDISVEPGPGAAPGPGTRLAGLTEEQRAAVLADRVSRPAEERSR